MLCVVALLGVGLGGGGGETKKKKKKKKTFDLDLSLDLISASNCQFGSQITILNPKSFKFEFQSLRASLKMFPYRSVPKNGFGQKHPFWPQTTKFGL